MVNRRLILALVILGAVGVWQWRRVATPADRPPPAGSADATTPSGRATTPPPAPTDSVSRPTRDLSVDESRGGHTLARHVGQTDAALRERLAREPGISAASTYTDRAIAETTVGRVLAEQAPRIQTWAERKGNRPNLALSYKGSAKQIIGRTLPRGRREAIPSTDAVVVLRWDGRGFLRAHQLSRGAAMTPSARRRDRRPTLSADDVPALVGFARAYLHEDVLIEYGSAVQAVRAFCQDASPTEQTALATDFARLITAAAGWSAATLARWFREHLGAAWSPDSFDGSRRTRRGRRARTAIRPRVLTAPSAAPSASSHPALCWGAASRPASCVSRSDAETAAGCAGR